MKQVCLSSIQKKSVFATKGLYLQQGLYFLLIHLMLFVLEGPITSENNPQHCIQNGFLLHLTLLLISKSSTCSFQKKNTVKVRGSENECDRCLILSSGLSCS